MVAQQRILVWLFGAQGLMWILFAFFGRDGTGTRWAHACFGAAFLLLFVLAWFVRTGTRIDERGIHLRRPLRSRSIPWDLVASLVPTNRFTMQLQVRTVDDKVVTLPGVPAGQAESLREVIDQHNAG